MTNFRNPLTATMCIAAAFLVASSHAQAQCPAPPANPLSLLNGTTWTFQTIADDPGTGAIGKFTATMQAPTTINPFTNGILSVTMTTNDHGNVTVNQQSGGRYTINSTCTGGELFINANGNAVQYAFTFVNGQTEMYMVSNNTSPRNLSGGQFFGIHGSATLRSTFMCPSLPDPLFFLGSGLWGFEAYDSLGAAVGTFTASVQQPTAKNPFLAGLLSGLESGTTALGNVFTDLPFAGRYQVDPDCGGGILYMNVNSHSYQYYFVLADNPTRLLMLSDTEVPNNSLGGFLGNRGIARPF